MWRPQVLAAVYYISGIALREYLPLPMGLLLFMGLAAAAWWVWDRFWAWRKSPLPFLACWVIIGMVMNQWAVQRTEELLAVKPGIRAEFTGIIVAEPVRKDDRLSYVVQVHRVQQKNRLLNIKGKVLVNLRQSNTPPAYGDLIRFFGIPELPPQPGNPGQFDYRQYLYNKGLVLIVNLWGDGPVRKLAADRGSLLQAAAIKVKERLTGVLDETMPPDQSALLKGILFGIRAEIDPVTQQEFVDTGVVHILSVSGYHIGLVLAGCCFLNGMLKLSRRNFTFFAAGVLIFYTALTGAQPAVVRATLMAMVLLAGHLLEKDRDWPVSLALAALIILVVNPRTLYNIGFQLSFTATWGILYIGPLLQNSVFRRLPRNWRALVAVPLAAQLAVLSLSAYYFNQVSVIALPANLIIVPLIGLVTQLGTLAVLGGVVWIFWAEVVNISTGLLIVLVIKINAFLAGLPGAVLYLKSPPVWAVILYIAGIILFVEGFCRLPFNQFIRRICYTRGKHIVAGGLVVLLPAIVVPLVYQPLKPLSVTFIDVGSGDSILIRTPRGRVMLIDAGGSNDAAETGFDTGAKILVPVLRNYGISKIDALVLTHMHLDHTGGAPAVLDKIRVKKLVLPPGAVQHQLSATAQKKSLPAAAVELWDDQMPAKISRLAGKESVEMVTVSAGDRIMLDPGIRIEVLAPQQNIISAGSADLNNNSIVLKLSYGRDSILLTSDIEAAAMAGLLAARRDLQADVLKIPHHGSRNSLVDNFYKKVNPALAVISVGRNPFGHPAGEVLEALEAHHIRIARTDIHGAVTLISEGQGWQGQTVKKGEI